MRWKRPRLKTLDFYVLRRFLSIYVTNLFSFTLIFILVDATSHYERYTKAGEGLSGFLHSGFKYYTAVTPVIFCQILAPVISVSAALFSVTTLQRTNEFTPILATGRSLQRTLVPVLLASLGVSICVFLIQELWIPRTVSSLREALGSRQGGSTDANVKYLDNEHGNLIVFKEYERLAQRATGVLVLPVSRTGGNQFLIQARSAEWRALEVTEPGSIRGYWLLRDGRIQEYDKDLRLVIHEPPTEWKDARPRLFQTFVERKLDANLIPEDLQLKREETMHMSLADLSRKAETSPDHSIWLIKYYSRFAYALTNFVLVLIGMPVIIYFGNRNILFGALISVGVSTLYFVVNSVFQDLGVRGHLAANLAAGLTPIFFMSLGFTLYRDMRS